MKRIASFHRALMLRRAVLSWSLSALLAAAGCSHGHSSAPPETVSRTALEGALKAWRDGGKPGPLAGTDPEVQVFDTSWSQGDRLESYEILSEDANNAERRFKVRLSLSKPKRVDEVQYYVIGQKPLLVFRDQDYLKNMNMEETPKPAKGGKGKTSARK